MTAIQEQITLQKRSKEIQVEQQISDNIEEPKYFYRLLIIQLVIILISTFLLTQKWFFYQNNNPKCNINFETYCQTYERCSENYEYQNQIYYQKDYNRYELWKNRGFQESKVYTNLYYLSLILFPLFLILQSVFRNYQLFKKRQKLLHYMQYPLMSLFIQVCTHLIKQTELKNSLYHFRILLICLIGSATFFYLNQKYFKWQLEIKSTTQKFVNYSLIIIFIKGIQDFITFNQSYWIPHILFLFYTQVYLLHLNTNLFQQNNKYVVHNQTLLFLTINKIKSLFDVQDVYKQMAETHFIISSKMMKTWIIGIIFTIILRDYILSLQSLIVLVGVLMIIVWDTSLVSTSSKFTFKDQYQTASLFFLDILLPIRNIILVLLA